MPYDQRSAMRRGRPVGSYLPEDRVRPHGTRAARRRHAGRGEPPCPACEPGAVPASLAPLPCGCPSIYTADLEASLACTRPMAELLDGRWIHA
jgi:hypothetical protein